MIFGKTIWFQGNLNLRGVLTNTLHCESEKTTVGILKTASRALVEAHAHSVSAGIFQESCEVCRQTQTNAIALETIILQSDEFEESKCLLLGLNFCPNFE